MTPEQIEEIVAMLAKKLGPMAQTVWEAYMTQAMLSGMRASVAAMVLAVLTAISAVLLVWFFIGCRSEDKSEKEFCEGAAFVDGVVFAGLLGTTIWQVLEAYMRVHNPAYYAIQMLLGR